MRVSSYPAEITIERTPLGRIVVMQGDQLIYCQAESLRAFVEAIWRTGTDIETYVQRHKVPA